VTDVAVVGFAQSPCGVREDATTSGVEMLVPIFAEVFGATGLTKAERTSTRSWSVRRLTCSRA